MEYWRLVGMQRHVQRRYSDEIGHVRPEDWTSQDGSGQAHTVRRETAKDSHEMQREAMSDSLDNRPLE